MRRWSLVSSISGIVTVSGTGAPAPTFLTYQSTAYTPVPFIQSNIPEYSVVRLNGSDAYVCTGNQISAIDVSNPQSPQVGSTFGQSDIGGAGTSCAVSQDYLVELVNGAQFLVYDLLNTPTQPPLVAGPFTLQIAGAGNVIFAGSTGVFDTASASVASDGTIQSESGAIETYNFANFTVPVYAATYQPPTGFTDASTPRFGMTEINNQYAVVLGTTNASGAPTQGSGLFTVIDVTNSSNPQALVEVPVSQARVLQEIALQGSIALITGNTQSWANPVSDPNAPQLINGGDLTLTFVDFTDPANPVVLNTYGTIYQTSGPSQVTSLGGGFFAIAIAPPAIDPYGPATLAVIDARDESAVAFYPVTTIDGLSGLAASGGYLYAATNLGLNIYALTLPPS